MGAFDEHLGCLAAEYARVCNENENLWMRLQSCTSLDREISKDVAPKVQRLFSTDTLHSAPVIPESTPQPPTLVSGNSLRYDGKLEKQIQMDWRDFYDPGVESGLDEVANPDTKEACDLLPTERMSDSVAVASVAYTNASGTLTTHLAITHQRTEPDQRWFNMVQAMLLIAAEPPVHIDVRDAWVATRTPKRRNLNTEVVVRNGSAHRANWLEESNHSFLSVDASRRLNKLAKSITHVMSLCMLHPQSRILAVWGSVCIFVISFDILMAPLECFFALSYRGPVADALTTIRFACYTLDILVSFSTGYYDRTGNLVTRVGPVAKRYLKSWFRLDITLVLLDALALILDAFDNPTMVLSFVRSVRIFRLLRLVRLVRIDQHLQAIPFQIGEFAYSNAKRATFIGRMVKLAFQIIVAIHFLSCAWYGLGSAYDDGWVHASNMDKDTKFEAYLDSCDWAIALIHGTAHIRAQNLIEQIIGSVARLMGFWIMAWVVASITATVSLWRDDNLVQLHETRTRYAKRHKISTQLNIRVHEYLKNVHVKRAVQEALQQEKKWLSLLPTELQKDLHEEARAKIIVLAPVFREIGLRCPNAMRRICYEAISCKGALWMDRVFAKEDPCSETYFVESGMLAYSMASGDLNADKQPLELAVAINKISQSRRCLCEAALWAAWQHCGDLTAVRDSSLLALDVHIFAAIILSFDIIASKVQDYAKRYVFRLNAPEISRSDVIHVAVPFDRSDAAESLLRGGHFMFLSHYKVEAGTEAALMRDELRRMIEEDPYHPASEMKIPVFLDSEDLENLMELESHVLKSKNLVVLLTPNIIKRPWCLIEFVKSMENGINVIPVRVERPGMTFEFPTESSYYEQLRSGEMFSTSELALFQDMELELSTIEKAVKRCFVKIALPFSPHKPMRIRRAELAAILDRCSCVCEHTQSSMSLGQ